MTTTVKYAIQDEQDHQQDVDEWKRQLDILGAEFGRVRNSFVQAVGQREAATRRIAYAQFRVENGQVQANEATEKKQAFLDARDEKNYFLLYRELFLSTVGSQRSSQTARVEDPGAMAALNGFQLFDFRRFLVNGGLEQDPAMGGRNINLSRERNESFWSDGIYEFRMRWKGPCRLWKWERTKINSLQLQISFALLQELQVLIPEREHLTVFFVRLL